MSEAERITDPSLVQEFYITTGLSSLSNETSTLSSESPLQRQPVRLALLQPLTNADMLEACRNPDSRLIRKPNCLVCRTSKHEYLDMKPLSEAWRKALMEIPPIPHLIFDLALPEEDEKSKGSFQKVYWDTGMPEEDSLGVHYLELSRYLGDLLYGQQADPFLMRFVIQF